MKKLFLMMMVMFLIPCISNAWMLVWDANTETDLAGYRIYTSMVDDPVAWELLKGSKQYIETVETCHTLDPMDEGNYYRVTAFDLVNNESGFSNSVYFDIPEPPDTIAPAIPGNPRITDDVCPADITLDGTVNFRDMYAFYGNFINDFGRKDCLVSMSEVNK